MMIPIVWKDREPPLQACAVVARGEIAHRLAHRVLEASDEQLARWRGVANDELLVLLGERDELPWTDGATYLGRDEQAPSLLLPTTKTVTVPVALFERALLLQLAGHMPPLAVFTEGQVVSLVGARPISREVLSYWLDIFRKSA